MKRLEMLCATMRQADFSKIAEMRVQSDVVFANQSDSFSYDEIAFDGYKARMFTTATRGVGLNRNLALLMADAELCMIADDDVVYSDGYADRVCQAFDDLPGADVIVFGLLISDDARRESIQIKKVRKMGPFTRNPYPSPCVAVRLESIRKANIWFTTLFGGGCRYACGEDSYFLRECIRKGLSVYTHPYVVGQTGARASTWFTGYGKSYFFSKGAYFRMAHPGTYRLWFLYCVLKDGKKSDLPWREAIRCMADGSRGFGKGLSYSE